VLAFFDGLADRSGPHLRPQYISLDGQKCPPDAAMPLLGSRINHEIMAPVADQGASAP